MYSPSRCKNHTCTGLQTTPFHGGQYRAGNGNLLNFGLPIAMLLCLHQSNVYIKRKPILELFESSTSALCEVLRPFAAPHVSTPLLIQDA